MPRRKVPLFISLSRHKHWRELCMYINASFLKLVPRSPDTFNLRPTFPAQLLRPIVTQILGEKTLPPARAMSVTPPRRFEALRGPRRDRAKPAPPAASTHRQTSPLGCHSTRPEPSPTADRVSNIKLTACEKLQFSLHE